jgi:multidrug efflux pump subunit AcrB
MPAGAVVDNRGERRSAQMLSVEAGEFLRNADDVGDLVVGISQGKPVFLRDVARISHGAQQARRYVWFTPGAGHGG